MGMELRQCNPGDRVSTAHDQDLECCEGTSTGFPRRYVDLPLQSVMISLKVLCALRPASDGSTRLHLPRTS